MEDEHDFEEGLGGRVHPLEPPTYDQLLRQVEMLNEAMEERDETQFAARHEAELAESRRAHALNTAIMLASQDSRPWEADEVVEAASAFADFLSGLRTAEPVQQTN